MAKKKLTKVVREFPTYVTHRSLRDTAGGNFVSPKTKPQKGKRT